MSEQFAGIDPNSQLGSINDEDNVHVFFQREDGHIYDQKYQPRGQRYSVHDVTAGLISPPPDLGAPFAVLLVKTFSYTDKPIYGVSTSLHLLLWDANRDLDGLPFVSPRWRRHYSGIFPRCRKGRLGLVPQKRVRGWYSCGPQIPTECYDYGLQLFCCFLPGRRWYHQLLVPQR